MFTIGSLGFVTPLLLIALAALPILWLLLRAVPPAPIKRMFPAVALLLGLDDDENETDKTPWWLLLLRMAAIGALIIGFAGPVLNPQDKTPGSGPLLVVVDGTWADARDWKRRVDRVDALLAEASRDGRTAAVVALTDLPQGDLPFQAANLWADRLPSLVPNPWSPDPVAIQTWWDGIDDTGFDTFWLSDGVSYSWREEVLEGFEARGVVTVFESPRPVYGLRPATFEDGAIVLTADRAVTGDPADIAIEAHGLDPSGVPRVLARTPLSFGGGDATAEVKLSLPPELRNRITRFELEGIRSAEPLA
jgi:hypothetical protein